MNRISSALRLFHTLRHLRARQVVYQIRHRLTRRPVGSWALTRVPGDEVARFRVSPLEKAIATRANPFTGPEHVGQSLAFTFLNQQVRFPNADRIDWNYAANGKLWAYNLNYFEYLRSPNCSAELGQSLIKSWIDGEGTHLDGWEPYPTSLRLVNWAQFYRIHQLALPDRVKASLLRQERSLTDQLEYHLDGNHLLENALALSFIARCSGDEDRRASADRLLKAQLRCQYLADGAHYELSVMYQLTLLWRGLDLYSLLGKQDTLTPVLKQRLEAQLAFVTAMVDDHGYYPHFNDSTNGIAPSPDRVSAYAEALGLQVTAGQLAACGYRRWRWPTADLWIDVAAIGPDHIPGHAHADNLTFCLNVRGRPVIVDTGISTYEKNARRSLERGTAAHNTVYRLGKDSSQIWGGFRVGERASTELLGESANKIVARHDGYPGGHTRTFVRLQNGVRIIDLITGEGEARFHLDHQSALTLTEDSVDAGAVKLHVQGGTLRQEVFRQCLGFNNTVSAPVVIVTFAGQLTTEVYFQF